MDFQILFLPPLKCIHRGNRTPQAFTRSLKRNQASDGFLGKIYSRPAEPGTLVHLVQNLAHCQATSHIYSALNCHRTHETIYSKDSYFAASFAMTKDVSNGKWKFWGLCPSFCSQISIFISIQTIHPEAVKLKQVYYRSVYEYMFCLLVSYLYVLSYPRAFYVLKREKTC